MHWDWLNGIYIGAESYSGNVTKSKAFKKALFRFKSKKCEECGIYPADYPSKFCPGCEAYKEHQQ